MCELSFTAFSKAACRGLLAGGLGLAGLALAASPALAVGTEAGTTVSNTVSVAYNVGGVAQTASTDTAEFVVDRKIDVTVAAAGTNQVIPGQAAEVLAYTVTNTGNGEQGYDIDVSVAGGGTALGLTLGTGAAPAAGEYVVYIDANDNGVFDAGTDTQYAPSSGSTTLAFNLGHATNTTNYAASTTVFIVANIPASAVDGAIDTITVTATTLDVGTTTVTTESATNDLATEETVFADGAGTADAATDGIHSNEGVYEVVTATLVVSKTMQVISENPTNCVTDTVSANQYALPGACIEYTITVTNNGSANAENVALTDVLPTEVTFSGFHSSTSTFDTGPSEAAGTVSATANNIAGGGGSVQLVIRALID
ncbi:MAG: DUF11 domain-containing protein [Alphaproteobacteria bacterium]|nr:DUF11 domain-containing protein [Alphaproteobacteria bacterium]MDX5369240.1 DUF11 domain-containing protein [Alphaproteobacteria bacterium]MDX5463929.1 DUF11 domain-containing protein [Alphaproteobacteria bacterium]